jgi:ubiquinol-cytochrome c reductase cytochrome c1 subunit
MSLRQHSHRPWVILAAMASILAFSAMPSHGQEGEEAAEAHEEEHETPHYPLEVPERESWSFAGPFGTYDAAQLQRGLQVYRQVCGVCHGLERVAFRTLADDNGLYLSEERMRTVAAAYRVLDDETGELREARPADYFPDPNFPGNVPDLSLMAKARASGEGFSWLIDWIRQYQESGVNYIYALLTGYGQEVPEGIEIPAGTFYNPYFLSGAAIGMPPPLSDGRVAYGDGTPETVEQYAADVTAFLMWTAEPTLVDRKWLGFLVMAFLIGFAVLAYLAKRAVWSRVH